MYRQTVVWLGAASLCALLALSGCKRPEEKLAAHLEEVAEILEADREDADDRLDTLREYARSNLPDMVELAAELIAELDGLKSSDRKDRIEEIGEALGPAVERLTKAAEELIEDGDDGDDVEDWFEDFGKEYVRLADPDLLGDLAPILMGRRHRRGRNRSMFGGSKCEQLADHLRELLLKEAGPDAVKFLDGPRRQEFIDSCEKEPEEMIECALEAKTVDDISRCQR